MTAELFCEDCPHCRVISGVDEAYGCPRVVEEYVCRKADFDPTSEFCPYSDDFIAQLNDDERDIYGIPGEYDDDE